MQLQEGGCCDERASAYGVRRVSAAFPGHGAARDALIACPQRIRGSRLDHHTQRFSQDLTGVLALTMISGLLVREASSSGIVLMVS